MATMRIDLGLTAPARLGRLALNPALREIQRDDGAEEVVEPRVMQVLLALAEARGAIVRREDLTERCWEGRVVGEDAINRVLSRLRRVAEGIGADSFRIETITRIGYRLVELGDHANMPGAPPPQIPADGDAAPARAPVPRKGLFTPSRIWLAGAAAIAVALSGALLWHSGQHAQRGSRIAIQPFHTIGGPAALKDFAAGLSDSLQNVLTQDQLQMVSPADAQTLQTGDVARRAEALGVGLMFSGAVQPKGQDIGVSMRLDDPVQHATLWTAEMSGPAKQADQLQARVGALTVAVLNCSAQGLAPGVRLTDTALQAFLHACELSQTNDHGMGNTSATYAMLDAMREAAREAPNFAAAHSVLSKHLAFVAAEHLLDHTDSLRAEAQREADRTFALDPRDPDAFVTLGLLAPRLDFAKREHFFRRALAVNPAWPHANGFLGNVMSDTGRMREAASLYQRAASVNPQATDWAFMAATGLVYTGDAAEADRELARLMPLWPDDSQGWTTQLDSMIAQKRWGDALRLMDHTGNISISPDWAAYLRDSLKALQSGDRGAREAVRRDLLAHSTDAEIKIERLALLGFPDDVFDVARRELRIDRNDAIPWLLFIPQTASLHRDPRFMALAARFGLVDYWRKTGQWPDFCSQPGLPYDCKVEAAKLGRGGKRWNTAFATNPSVRPELVEGRRRIPARS